MKKLLFPILAAAVLASCGDDGNDPDKSNYISRADIEGVRLIYTVPNDEGLGEQLMTVDAEGNTEPLHFITSQGDRVPVDTMGNQIDNSRRLSDDYMILSGNFDLGQGEIENLLVNTRTGELCHTETDFSSFGHEAPTFEDGSGNLYLLADEHGDDGIFRIDLSDPSKPAVDKYVTGSNDALHYWVNRDGLCYYRIDGVYYIKFPYGGIREASSFVNEKYDPSVTVFCGRNQNFYIAARSTDRSRLVIYELDYSQNGAADGTAGRLSSTYSVFAVAELDNISMPSMSTRVFCPIPQTGKHIFSTGRDLIVFDEDEPTLTNVPTSEIPDLIMAYSTSNNAWASLGTLWINVEGNRLSRLTAAGGYTTQPVDFGGAGYTIDFEEVACLPDREGLMAPALRHSDGQNVIIRISDAGTVTELEQTATSGEISSLIRLD